MKNNMSYQNGNFLSVIFRPTTCEELLKITKKKEVCCWGDLIITEPSFHLFWELFFFFSL